MKKFSSASQQIGELGEHIACRYLYKHKFIVKERNYTKRCGEIDIIAQKGAITHFIEVKSVSREMISAELSVSDDYQPEDQMHPYKQARLKRTIEIYLNSHSVGEWQFDLVCVFIDDMGKKALIKVMEDVILA